MIIEKIGPINSFMISEYFGGYCLDDYMLTIGDVTVDLAAEQGDQQVIITFGHCEDRIHRGLVGKCCEYAAEVIIPPRRYETVEVDGPAGMFSDEDNDDGIMAVRRETVPVPLDTNTVTLRLWPVKTVMMEKMEKEKMEETDGAE